MASSTGLVGAALYMIVSGLLVAEVNINTMCALGMPAACPSMAHPGAQPVMRNPQPACVADTQYSARCHECNGLQAQEAAA